MFPFECDFCGEELDEPGGLLFGPPLIGEPDCVTKKHICLECWDRLRVEDDLDQSIREAAKQDPHFATMYLRAQDRAEVRRVLEAVLRTPTPDLKDLERVRPLLEKWTREGT